MTNQTPESVIAEVIEYHADTIGSHYDGCYKRHAVCLAVKLRDMLREPGWPDAATGTVCAWCPQPARGDAWHNDGKQHPSCGQIGHGQGWVPDYPVERIGAIEAERDAATAAIERIRAIHVRDEYGLCAECSWEYPDASYDAISNDVSWPCPTIQALGDVSSDQNLINPHNHAEVW